MNEQHQHRNTEGSRLGNQRLLHLGIIETGDSLTTIGGLASLKDWLAKRARAFLPSAETYGLPMPKGVLLAGIPGARAAGSCSFTRTSQFVANSALQPRGRPRQLKEMVGHCHTKHQ